MSNPQTSNIKKGILLVNLGSPKSTSVKDVTEYLDEFLMDERVIDIRWLFRSLLVQGIILKTRPKKVRRSLQNSLDRSGITINCNLGTDTKKASAGSRCSCSIGNALCTTLY